jgi:hypothetical protein
MAEAGDEAVLHGKLSISSPFGVAVRPMPEGPQALVAFNDNGRCLRVMEGAATRGSLKLGPRVQLFRPAAAGQEGVPYELQARIYRPCYDAYSDSLFCEEGGSVLRIQPDGTTTRIAGHTTQRRNVNGPGSTARFASVAYLCSTGSGVLFADDLARIRKLQLPESWRVADSDSGCLNLWCCCRRGVRARRRRAERSRASRGVVSGGQHATSGGR